MIRRLLLIAAVSFCLVTPGTASAYWPTAGAGYWGYGGGYGNGWNWGPPTDYVPAPPYYAIYPPVYYSHQITARPYGASPFAWQAGLSPITYVPQGSMTSPEPQMIENPFVARKAAQATALETGVIEPVSIVNPHVAQR